MKTKRYVALVGVFVFLALLILMPRPSHGQIISNNKYAYISTAATTTVSPQPGYLSKVIVNGGTAGVITLYDIGGGGCSGTPASGKFATIASGTAPFTLAYELRILNGICVVTAAATDVTVTFN